MGCCSPEYRKVVEEQESKVNEQQNDFLSLPIKLGIVLITIGAMVIAYLVL